MQNTERTAQLEKLILEKQVEIEKLQNRVAFLDNLLKEKNQATPDILREIYDIADCIGALELEALVHFNSVKRLASYIMDICNGEKKSRYYLGGDTACG